MASPMRMEIGRAWTARYYKYAPSNRKQMKRKIIAANHVTATGSAARHFAGVRLRVSHRHQRNTRQRRKNIAQACGQKNPGQSPSGDSACTSHDAKVAQRISDARAEHRHNSRQGIVRRRSNSAPARGKAHQYAQPCSGVIAWLKRTP